MMITTVIADDHSIVRQGVRALLDAEEDFEVIAEAEDGLGAYTAIEKYEPNVAILDTMMPGLNGIEVTRHVRERSLDTRIMILSMYSDEVFVLEALRNGADGYVLKNETTEVLVQAIRDVLEGKRFLSQPLSDRAINSYVNKAMSVVPDEYDSLTPREREIFQLMAEGNTNVQIGDRLSISPRTVEGHRTNVLKKLQLSNHTELIRYAIRRGVISIDA